MRTRRTTERSARDWTTARYTRRSGRLHPAGPTTSRVLLWHACACLLQEGIATKTTGESCARCTEGGPWVRRPCATRARWMARGVPVTALSKCTLCTHANTIADYVIDAYMQQDGVARRQPPISWSRTPRYHTSRASVFYSLSLNDCGSTSLWPGYNWRA